MFKRSQIPFHHQQIFHITDEMYQKKKHAQIDMNRHPLIKKNSEIANTERKETSKGKMHHKTPIRDSCQL